MYSFRDVCWHRVFPFCCHNLFLSATGMMSPVGSVGSATSQLQALTLHFTVRDVTDKSLFHVQVKARAYLCERTPYLQAGVGTGMTEVVESPWFRGGVHRFPLEFRGHTIGPRKLEYTHGDGTLLPGWKQMRGWMIQKEQRIKVGQEGV